MYCRYLNSPWLVSIVNSVNGAVVDGIDPAVTAVVGWCETGPGTTLIMFKCPIVWYILRQNKHVLLVTIMKWESSHHSLQRKWHLIWTITSDELVNVSMGSLVPLNLRVCCVGSVVSAPACLVNIFWGLWPQGGVLWLKRDIELMSSTCYKSFISVSKIVKYEYDIVVTFLSLICWHWWTCLIYSHFLSPLFIKYVFQFSLHLSLPHRCSAQ